MRILHAKHRPGVPKAGRGHGRGRGKAQNQALMHLLRTRHSLDAQPQGNPWHLEGCIETHSWEMYTKKEKDLCPLRPTSFQKGLAMISQENWKKRKVLTTCTQDTEYRKI